MQHCVLSMIIPVFNGSESLRKCLDTVVSHTNSASEILVINDGSTDDTELILKDYQDIPGFRYITTENRGVSAARNYGISLASGDYVWFIDCDDFIEPSFLDYVVPFLINHSVPWDLIVFGSHTMKHSGSSVHQLPTDLKLETTEKFRLSFDRIFSIIPYNVPWNKIFRRNLLLIHGLQFPPICNGEDAIFFTNYLPYVTTCFASSRSPYFYEARPMTSGHAMPDELEDYQYHKARILHQIRVFKELGFSCERITAEQIYNLIYGTYILLFLRASKTSSGYLGFRRLVRSLPDKDILLDTAALLPVTTRERLIRSVVIHPFVFYVYSLLRRRT